MKIRAEGAKPTEKHLLQVGLQAGLGKTRCIKIINDNKKFNKVFFNKNQVKNVLDY